MRASTAITWFGGKLDKTIVGSRDESMCVMLSTVALALLQCCDQDRTNHVRVQ